MEHYKVTLSEQERAELQGIAGKGTHAAQKVINALILLNCDQSGGCAERVRPVDRWPPASAAAGPELLGTARRPSTVVAAAAGRPAGRARIGGQRVS